MADDAQRIADCRELYDKYGGRRHEQIEREMRMRGHARFCRRILYTRRERGQIRPGWIDRFGWQRNARRNARTLACTAAGNAGTLAPTDAGNAGPLAPTDAGNAGILARMDASASRANTGNHAKSTDDGRLAGGTGDAGRDARVPSGAGDAGRDARVPADFQAWLKSVSPGMTWDWRHQLYIYEHLKRVTTGTCKRLMIFLPPRHGKSELVTVRYSAWRLRQDPTLRVILSCYNQSLANNFSRKVRRVLCDDWSASIPACMDATASRPNIHHHAGNAVAGNAGALARVDAEASRANTGNAGILARMDAEASRPDPHHHAPSIGKGHLAGGTGDAGRDARVPGGTGDAGRDARVPSGTGDAGGDARVPSGTGDAGGDARVPSGTGDAGRDARVPASPGSPFPFTRQRPANSVAEWETTVGGGLRAVGVGGGVTGFGAQLIVIDDPVKSRAEAESPKIREKIWNWFNDDLYTRLEPGGSIVLIQTRWHEDDLAGRLLREMDEGGEQWEVISLPALAEHGNAGIPACMDAKASRPDADHLAGNAGALACMDATASRSNAHHHAPLTVKEPLAGGTGDAGGGARVPGKSDPLDRSPGEALCPERYDKPALENLQRKLGTYSFSALYQQQPTPAEGMIFKREWFVRTVKRPPPGLKWTRGYDLAVSTKTTADYTASFRVAYDTEGNLYIDGGFRKRVEFPEQRRYILGRIVAELDTEHGIELALHGQGIMQELRRSARLQGRRFSGIKVEGDKLTRALTWSNLAEEGRVILVRGPWNADFIAEACAFPGGLHDDQIDAVSIAVRMHQKRGSRLIRF